jgi:hypothetical protein
VPIGVGVSVSVGVGVQSTLNTADICIVEVIWLVRLGHCTWVKTSLSFCDPTVAEMLEASSSA